MCAYVPEWKGAFEGYATNFVTRNGWKVARVMDREDAMQEAHLVFLRCVSRYQVEDPKHFMALYKRMLSTHFIDAAKASSAVRDNEVSSTRVEAGEDDTHWETAEAAGALDVDAEIHELIRKMPARVRAVVSLFVFAPEALTSEALATWASHTRGGKNRAGSSEHLNKLLGFPKGSDPIGEVVAYFSR